MSSQFDLIIRNGRVVDGSGSPPILADVAIRADMIVAVGKVEGTAVLEVDAADRLVTPGFIDIHTHYDGQVTWESTLAPSSNHGVTTVVMGNCGVGFAPCRESDRQTIVKVMEGVEDIPEVVMVEGIPWKWESFPEYLDYLDTRTFDIDVAAQIAHSPLRVHVMGERGADHEPATADELAQMRAIVTQAVEAGAIGVSTSRSPAHVASNGKLAPSVNSAERELLALAEGLRLANGGVFQMIPELRADPMAELATVEAVARAAGRPVSFTLLQMAECPENWRVMLSELERLNACGLHVRGQVFARPIGGLFGLDLSLHPFSVRPSYGAIAHLPLAQRVARMRDPDFKARLLAEEPVASPQPMANKLMAMAPHMFEMGDRLDYFPGPEETLGARAARAGVTLDSFVYDLLLGNDGRAMLYAPMANYSGCSSAPVREMMAHPLTVLGLGDGGAHYGVICDTSYTTFTLSYWARDVVADQRFPVEWAVAQLSRRPAETVGLYDRGLLAPGYKADLNVIDFDRLGLHSPRAVYDLPGGGRRLRQQADGYDMTIVSGVITYRDGKPTGKLPGRLVRRGNQSLAEAA